MRRARRIAAALALAALPSAAAAQSLSIDLGAGGETTARILQILALMTVLSLAPSILIMVTSFTRIVVVLSLLRSALGVQQTPPNGVLISLAIFLTAFIMGPTLERSWREGIVPLLEERIDERQAFDLATRPFHAFMTQHVREKDLALFLDMARQPRPATIEETPLLALVPAFVISELRRAFEIGFLIFVPFLVIDMVVASVLMAMGMMMLPPIVISLPFKLIFFVLVDGWNLLAGALVASYAGG